jgi:hypothetical protein
MPGPAMYIISQTGDAQDNYFTANPQISYFSSVFRKHTKFSIQTTRYQITPDSSENGVKLHYTNDTKSTIKIRRDGDLLKSLYISVDLPDIYSGIYNASNSYKFKWIRSIGYHMIKNIKLSIGTTVIQEYTGEFLDVAKELYLSKEEKEATEKCIGHLPELYDPARGKGQVELNTSTDKYIPLYPNSVKNSTTNGVYGGIDGSYSGGGSLVNASDTINTSTTFPSIQGRTLKIPIQFYFQRNSGFALPLIALSKMETELEITFRPVKDLFTILNNTGDENTIATQRGKLSTGDISIFTSETETNGLDINPQLEANYVFLTTNERRRFVTEVNRYLIEKVRKIDVDNINITTSNERSIQVKSENHVKEIIIVPKRSDAQEVNEWDNYTNWIQKDVPPYSFYGQFGEALYNNTQSEFCFPNLNIAGAPGLPSKSIMKKDIIETIELKLDNNTLFERQDNMYYQNQVPLEYHKSNPKDGIHVYSFSLMPKEKQPTGSIGMSGHTLTCNFKFQDLSSSFPTNTDYKFHIDIYVVEYNILKIMNGEASFEFI